MAKLGLERKGAAGEGGWTEVPRCSELDQQKGGSQLCLVGQGTVTSEHGTQAEWISLSEVRVGLGKVGLSHPSSLPPLPLPAWAMP